MYKVILDFNSGSGILIQRQVKFYSRHRLLTSYRKKKKKVSFIGGRNIINLTKPSN
jgi:hypothetical protein